MLLEILCGMIGSGKSLYARRRAEQGALVVSHDELLQMLHGGAYRYEEKLRDCYRWMEDDLVLTALRYSRDVVIDRTHLTCKSRHRWIDFTTQYFAVSREVRTVAVAFPVADPATHARRRFESQPRGRSYEDWLAVAWQHWNQWQPVTSDEGFTEIREENGQCS